MKLRGKSIWSLSLFVILFLGLNPVAVFCMARCNYETAAAPAAHCPLKKKSPSCHQSKQPTAPQDTTAFDTGSAKNCVIPVNVVAAPIEGKYSNSVDLAVVTSLLTNRAELASIDLVRSRQIPKYYYRPPPNDVRFERVRNQVFRI